MTRSDLATLTLAALVLLTSGASCSLRIATSRSGAVPVSPPVERQSGAPQPGADDGRLSSWPGRRPEPVLRVDAPEYVDRAPDLDKLERAALDALTGVLYLDDRQVARLSADKSWGDIPGVDVRARRL